MGNMIARTTQASATEYYLHDLPSTNNLVLLDVVSRGRFLKSVLCKHEEGQLIVKVYFKRAGEPIDLKEHEWRLERIRNAFEGLEGSHIWPFQVWLQTDKAAYLLRHHFYSNLHDRLSTRPFLGQIEKKWLAFQAKGNDDGSRGSDLGDCQEEQLLPGEAVRQWQCQGAVQPGAQQPVQHPLLQVLCESTTASALVA